MCYSRKFCPRLIIINHDRRGIQRFSKRHFLPFGTVPSFHESNPRTLLRQVLFHVRRAPRGHFAVHDDALRVLHGTRAVTSILFVALYRPIFTDRMVVRQHNFGVSPRIGRCAVEVIARDRRGRKNVT